MLRRLLPLLIVLTLAATACSGRDIQVDAGGQTGLRFRHQVVEFEPDVGRGVEMSVDGDGNPHLAFLGLAEELEPGEVPPAPRPGAPKLPAVLHAHLTEGLWTHSGVAQEVRVDQEDRAAIAVDGEGVHHVAWTAGGGLFYASNAGGSFPEEAEEIVDGGARGPSVAVDDQGIPFVSFYDDAGVQVAVRRDDAWSVLPVADADPADPASTSIGMGTDGPMIAYGDGDATMLAVAGEAAFEAGVADEDGGVGVDMSVDGDGNPHLAYMNGSGDVRHAHSVGGGPWETSEVGTTDAGEDALAPVTIAVDDQGVHHVAWADEAGLVYANNEEGSFAGEPLAGTDGGRMPVLGAAPENVLYLAWYRPQETRLQLSIRSEEAGPIALPPPTGEPTGGPPPPTDGEPACPPDAAETAITSPEGAAVDGFDRECVGVPAGDPWAVTLENTDAIPHNFSVYQTQEAAEVIAEGPIVEGGGSVVTEGEGLEAGNYFFRCDLHPQTMVGTFAVS